MKRKENLCEIWQKSEAGWQGKPLLLFVTYGYDYEKEMNFIRINGIRNPLPFKEIFFIGTTHLKSWLESNGWKKVGHRNMYDL